MPSNQSGSMSALVVDEVGPNAGGVRHLDEAVQFDEFFDPITRSASMCSSISSPPTGGSTWR